MDIMQLMKPFSEQPKEEDFNGLQWYDAETRKAVDVNQILGWLPLYQGSQINRTK